MGNNANVRNGSAPADDRNGWKADDRTFQLQRDPAFVSLPPGGASMGIWFAGLPRRSSAERAAKWGGIACLFQSVRETLGNLLSVSVAHKPLDHAIAWFVGQSLLPIFVAVAGMRLWRRGGWIWGSLAAVLLVADLAFAALNLAPAIDDYRRILATMPSLTSTMEAALLTGFAVKVAVVLLILNGVRGAVALTRVDYSEDLHRAFS